MQGRYFQVNGGVIDLDSIIAISETQRLNTGGGECRVIVTAGGHTFPLPSPLSDSLRKAFLERNCVVDEYAKPTGLVV